MVPLKEAMDNELWLKAVAKDLIFQIRPLSLTKVDIANEVDEPLSLEKIDLHSNVWLLKLDIVNLCREKQNYRTINRHLILMDSDEFIFPVLYDTHLNYYSKYSNTSNLIFFEKSGFTPKIKKSGAVVFELPEHFDNLFIGFNDGSIMEA